MTPHQEQDHRPLYRQLSDRLRSDIAGMKPGDRIESEPELVKKLGVSRSTVAKAIGSLVEECLLVRCQGKGTFVTVPPLRRAPGGLRSFSESVAASGRLTTSELLSFGLVAWRDELPYEPSETLIGFDRLRLADGMPLAIHHSVVSAALADEVGLTSRLVTAADFSLYRHFEGSGLRITHGVERLHARLPTLKERGLLQLEEGDVVVQVRRLSYATNGRLLEYVDAVHNSRRYSYEALLLRSPGEGATPALPMQENSYGEGIDYSTPLGPRFGYAVRTGDPGGARR